MKQIILTLMLGLAATMSMGQDDQASLNIGQDAFLAGSQVTLSEAGLDDVFIAGEKPVMASDISGSAHAVGRMVSLTGTVAQDVYAGGYQVRLTGEIKGDATLFGYELWLGGALGGDLRATGSQITIDAPIAGYALVAGESLTLNSTIDGDVNLAVENVIFGPDARITGTLTLFEKTDSAHEIPDYVANESQIERRSMEEWEELEDGTFAVVSWRTAIKGFLGGVVFIAAIAGLIAAVSPRHLIRMRVQVLDAPFRTFGLGFLSLAMLIGSAVLFALTIIGLVIAPVAIALAVLLAFLGYVIGAYALGVGLLLMFGRDEPEGWIERAIAGFIGALIAGLVALIPFVGWLFALTLTLAGAGAIAQRLFRPTFFTVR